MKNKKIFKTILLIGIILLAVGCGLASCKKTHAYDDIIITDGLDTNNAYQGLLIGYSLDLGDLQGTQIVASIGDDFSDFAVGSDIDQQNTYIFYDFSGGNNAVTLMINFYYTLENGNPTQINMQIFSFEENQLMWQITHTYGYYYSYDKFILFYWRPYTSVCNYQLIQFNNMAYETTTLNFNAIGGIQSVPIYNENYISSDYDEEMNSPYMQFKYLRTNLHSNEIMFISNVVPTYDLSYWINMYNAYLTRRYNYFNDLRITGFSGGYNNGYNEGASSSETQAFNDGKAVGYQLGLEDGYAQGMRGDNAVSSFINILTSIFTGIGAIFSIELFPHITIGLFLLVPLFFGVLGLILWIWRHN